MPVIYYADGACRNNGTTDCYAYGSYCREGMKPKRIVFKFDEASTSNQAEYMALIYLLEAIKQGQEFAEIRMDSQLVVNQVKGNFKVKDEILRRLHNKVIRLINQRGKVELRWVPRTQIQKAVGH